MNFTSLITLIAIIVVFVLFPIVLLRKKNKHASPPQSPKKNSPFDDALALPYTRRNLMTHTELAVYDILLDALPDYMVFTQVQASRVLASPDNYWFNFISRWSYDFVICRATDSAPIAAIEIDDTSHNRPDRIATDARKDKATTAAGVALIRWKVGQTPSKREILKLIQKIDKQTK